MRVPPSVAVQRRAALRQEAAHRGRAVSAQRLALCDWIILVTNVPTSGAVTLSLAEALVLYRARWQIERLFRLWKEVGQVDEWRSAKPWRILCEVYAKLLVMIVEHWVLLCSGWQYADRSWHQAAQTLQKHALHLASVWGQRRLVRRALQTIADCIGSGCRLNKRRKRPSTYQLLCDPGLSCFP